MAERRKRAKAAPAEQDRGAAEDRKKRVRLKVTSHVKTAPAVHDWYSGGGNGSGSGCGSSEGG